MKVKVSIEEITLPTYKIEKEDINPPFFEKNIYPYPKNDFLINEKENKKYKAIILENKYLKIIILPELGGRIYSVFDKISGKEVFYRNNVVKPALLGLRGAWISGGFEFNFLTNGTAGHTVTTISPIDYSIKENIDGSVTVFIGEIEQVSRMKWIVGITLRPDERLFEIEVKIFNRNFLPNRYYFWTNVAIPATEHIQYIYPMNKAYYYFYSMYRIWYMQDTYIGPYPILNGIDLSWQKNHVESNDIFGYDVKEDFFGYYDYKNEIGAIHVADHNIVQGRKIWNWGNSDNGLFFATKALTDEDGHYAEIQSGRFETQGIFGIMDPLIYENWKEYWYPISNTNGFTYANKLAAINIKKYPKNDKIEIDFLLTVNKEIKNATLQIFLKDYLILEDKISISPEKIYKKSLIINQGPIKVNLISSNGEKILTYIEEEVKEEVKLTKLMDRKKIPITPQDFIIEGLKLERYGDIFNAKKMYEKALEINPESIDGNLSLGKIFLQIGLYNDAEKCFRKVLEIDENNIDAIFHLGLALREIEKFNESGKLLWKLYNSQKYSSLASYLLGEIKINEKKYEDAEIFFRNSIKYNNSNIRALNGLAISLRKQGKYENAIKTLEEVLILDPLNCLSLYEIYKIYSLLKEEDKKENVLNEFEKLIKRTIHNCLEIAIEYIRFGLMEEAIEILEFALKSKNEYKENPLIFSYLSYCYLRLGNIEKAKKYASLIENCKLDYCFPNKLEEEKILRKIIESNIGNGKIYYCLGNLLFSKYRYDEALSLWEKAIELGLKYSVLHRNIGLALWKIKNNLYEALKEYEKAIELNKNDYRLYLEIFDIYEMLGLYEKEVKILESAPNSVLRNGNILAKLALAYFNIGNIEKALEILMKNNFPSREFKVIDFSIWDLYHDACIELGLKKFKEGKNEEALEFFKKAMEYPHNLGIGEPYRKLNADALYYAGIVYEKIGKIDEAKECWKKATIEEHEWWSELRYYEALSLQKLGKYIEAEKILNDMIEKANENLKYNDIAYWYFIKGLALKGKGKYFESIEELEKALKMDPTNRKCKRELKELKEKLSVYYISL
jgi:tetratricopeptide (TPR) repeat protein